MSSAPFRKNLFPSKVVRSARPTSVPIKKQSMSSFVVVAVVVVVVLFSELANDFTLLMDLAPS